MKRTPGKRSGFTLVEMLVAVALVLFILGLFAVLMQSAMQGVRDAKGINAVDQKLRNAVTLLKADLRQVYLANGGTRFSPAELFTRRDRIPTAGYFSIYENARSLPQGMDSFGNPVSVDYDDILAMTVARRGDSASEMFYGKASTGYSTCQVVDPTTGNLVPVDIGYYLDSLWNSPASRFDIPTNQMVSSRYAEVIYFARPQGETPTLFELNADPWYFGNQAANYSSKALPPQPRTFTLYRRQLLVLDDDALNRPAANGRGVGPVLIPNPGSLTAPLGSPYHSFDVSVSRELFNNGGAVQLAVQGGQNALHFNTLADLSRREFRYGMQPVFVDFPAPFNAQPYSNGAVAYYGFTRTLRSYPLSHVDSTAGGANPLPWIHDYYGYLDPAQRNAPSTAATSAGGAPNNTKLESWIGMPTLQESAHPTYPFWLPNAVDNTTPTVNLEVDPATGELATYPGIGQRAGEDVLLRDVISFDIKVLDDLGGYRGLLPDGSDDSFGIATQAAGAGGQIEYHDLTAGGGLYGSPAFPAYDTNMALLMGRRPQFVDLGYGADQSNYTVHAGGNDAAAATINCLTLSNYLFAPVPAPTIPVPNTFTINGVTYTYNAPAYGTGSLSFVGAPFTFAWPPTTPVSLALPTPPAPAALVTALMRGAYSPRSAPFGVPLDVKFWVTGNVNDADRQSDVYYGPDGKPGIGGFADVAPHTSNADTGVFDTNPAAVFGTTPGEYMGPNGVRSDDLVTDPTIFNPGYTPPATPAAAPADYVFYNRPGVLGPDFAIGERGKYDDNYIPPNSVPDAPVRPYPENAAAPNYLLGELFAVGSDDNPFVGIPFRLSGEVASVTNTIGGAKFHPFNLFNLNPRNTYDSWSAAPDLVNEYVPQVVLPSYKSSPVTQFQVFNVTWPGMPANAPPPQAVEKSYIPEPDFRPVPYPRPIKAVQVKIRVLERRTGIVREATVRHFFSASGTE